jgi:hypothetical protein
MCWYSTPTIENCLLTDNTGIEGGGISVYNNGPNLAVIRNCVFTANDGHYGGGVSGRLALLSGCTIVGNTDSGICDFGGLQVVNSVIWGNTPVQIDEGSPDITYSDIQGGWPGTGNIDADPLFKNPGAGDYRLGTGSPCIDAGDPSYQSVPLEVDYDGSLRVWDGNADGQAVVDMGAYEWGSFGYGDLNCDGVVDFEDIDAFILALIDPAAYQAMYPACSRVLADADGDGDVDFDDINPFVALLSGV